MSQAKFDGPFANKAATTAGAQERGEKPVMSSRITIPAREPGLMVTFGFDRPLMTYYAQVVRDQPDDDERDPVVLWVGTTHREILRPEDLVERLAPYVAVTADHLATLRADRAAGADRGPTPLQRVTAALTSRREA
jgi:hypothetical protein